jgi:hypothetical protein
MSAYLDDLRPTAADLDLERQVVAALEQLHIPSLRHLAVSAREGVVTLRGSVGSFYEHQLAHAQVNRTQGVERVVGEITVAGGPAARRRPRPVQAPQSPRLSPRLFVAGGTVLTLAAVVATALAWATRSDRPALYPVEGRITVGGKSAPGASLILTPVSSVGPRDLRPTAVVDSSGVFRVGTFAAADGVPPGEYLVTVRWQPLVDDGGEAIPGPNLVPPVYSQPQTTPLRLTVAAGQNPPARFDVPAEVLR